MTRTISFLACGLALLVASGAGAQNGDSARTTLDGVYNRAQWLRGQDLYAGNCRSCHTPESHAGETFVATWKGRTLAELFTYIRGSMPKSDPGSMSAEEYADVLAYLLRLNRLPTGPDELPADSTALATVRFHVPPRSTSVPSSQRSPQSQRSTSPTTGDPR